VRFGYWSSFDAAARRDAITAIQETVAEMPDDLRAEFARALRSPRIVREGAKAA